MKALLWGRFKNINKQRKLLITMLVLPMVFTYFFSLSNMEATYQIPVVLEHPDYLSNQIINDLKDEEDFSFFQTTKDELYKGIINGDYPAGVIFPKEMQSAFVNQQKPVQITIVRNRESATIIMLEQALQKVVTTNRTKFRLAEIIADELPSDLNLDKNELLTTIQQEYKEPLPIQVLAKSYEQDKEVKVDQKFQLLVGFTLFFTMYTIIFTLGELLEDRNKGVLARLIISPIKLYQIYLANFLFSFTIGFAQISLLVLFGKFAIGINWGEHLGLVFLTISFYVLATMSVGMILCGVSSNLQQLNALTPIVAVSFAMLGGAYWPIEVIQSKVLLMLAKITPIYHTMTALKEVVLNENGFSHIWMPISSLVIMTLLLFLIGLSLFQRKSKY